MVQAYEIIDHTHDVVVVGAGVHGLSTAYHLAMLLERTGRGRGSDVVLDRRPLLERSGPRRLEGLGLEQAVLERR